MVRKDGDPIFGNHFSSFDSDGNDVVPTEPTDALSAWIRSQQAKYDAQIQELQDRLAAIYPAGNAGGLPDPLDLGESSELSLGSTKWFRKGELDRVLAANPYMPRAVLPEPQFKIPESLGLKDWDKLEAARVYDVGIDAPQAAYPDLGLRIEPDLGFDFKRGLDPANPDAALLDFPRAAEPVFPPLTFDDDQLARIRKAFGLDSGLQAASRIDTLNPDSSEKEIYQYIREIEIKPLE